MKVDREAQLLRAVMLRCAMLCCAISCSYATLCCAVLSHNNLTICSSSEAVKSESP
jgi:hypothetical protein